MNFRILLASLAITSTAGAAFAQGAAEPVTPVDPAASVDCEDPENAELDECLTLLPFGATGLAPVLGPAAIVAGAAVLGGGGGGGNGGGDGNGGGGDGGGNGGGGGGGGGGTPTTPTTSGTN
ncbi:hypothetical protein AB3Y40_19595 [Yoonia sp. R2331]|uniref:hypothetical protein n=1 Tax=Yoonia sp. R2331 TaxID=3237238 RepID=UPI0034E40AF8